MRGWAAVVFGAVCLLSGSLWLLPATTPSFPDDLAVLALGAALAALAVIGTIIVSGHDLAPLYVGGWKLALSGVGCLGAPAVLLLLGRQQFSTVMAVAVQASVPVVVALASGVFEEGSDLQQGMVPGLVALGGALLVLPVALPASAGGWVGCGLYLAAACLTGVCSVLSHREMARLSLRTAVGIVTVANAIFLCAAAAGVLTITGEWPSLREIGTGPDVLVAGMTGLNLAGVASLLYLLRPLATSVRFVFAPLLAAVEAYALMRPTLSLRAGLGMLLMLVGGIACLRADRQPGERIEMSLR